MLQQMHGHVSPAGELTGMVTPFIPDWEQMLTDLKERSVPAAGLVRSVDIIRASMAPVRPAPLWWKVKNTLRMLRRGELFIPALAWLASRIPGITVCYGTLRGVQYDAAKNVVYDLGVLGHHLVTTAGKEFIAQAFTNTTEPEVMKYHAFGTGTTAADAADTALQTELTTQYASANTRPTGSQSNGSGATYITAATLTPAGSGTVAITEWMLMSQASNAGGTGLDRQVFGAVTLTRGSGDSLTTTYTFTVA